MNQEWEPGQRFAEMSVGKHPEFGGIWRHLDWSYESVEPGGCVITWEADTEYCFPAGDEWIVHGGMVTTLLDTAAGGATWSLLDEGEVFLTADLRTEFYRPARPGLLKARGRVEHKTRRITFVAADLYGPDDRKLAAARVTNMTLKV